MNTDAQTMNNILNQGVFTAAVEKELVRARTIKDFLNARIEKVKNMPISTSIEGRSIVDYEAKIKEIANTQMNEKNKNSFTQKLVQLKKIEEDLDKVKEEAYQKGYIEALAHVLKFINVLPPA
jgi:pimeloyl-CoA synthetase